MYFLVGSSILLLMAVQQLVVILVLSQEEMNASPSTLHLEPKAYLIFLTLSLYPFQSVCLSISPPTYLPTYLTI